MKEIAKETRKPASKRSAEGKRAAKGTYKPVPDVKALRYKGTPEKPDIKIFVSHRIDLDSEIIDNPLYIPVRCGAVYDKRENVTMLGDDTGDNISEKRLSYCELTVLYWAWKNIRADYYGLSHYRRYLCFQDKEYPAPHSRVALFDSMSKETLKFLELENETKMREMIQKYDIVTMPCYALQDVHITDCKSMKEFWLKHCPNYLHEEDFELLNSTVETYFPQYLEALQKIESGDVFRGYNIFVMKKEPFDKCCTFIFGVLSKMEEALTRETREESSTRKRTPGYLGEWLYTVWLYWAETVGKYDVKNTQLVGFQTTERANALKPAFTEENIPVVFAGTDWNRKNIAVSLQSVLDHISPQNNYDIIIIWQDSYIDTYKGYLVGSEDALLKKMCSNYPNVRLRIFDPKDYIGSVEVNYWGMKPRNEFAWYNLLLPWILSNYEKAVFLTTNILVNSDVAELYATDVSSVYFAAPKNLFFQMLYKGYNYDFRELVEKRELDAEHYACTDVIVENLKLMREDFVLQDVIEQASKFDNITGDAFNYIYSGRQEWIDNLWNTISPLQPEYYPAVAYLPQAEKVPKPQDLSVKAYSMSSFQPVCVPPQILLGQLYWDLARRTPFYEQLLLEMIQVTQAGAIGATVQTNVQAAMQSLMRRRAQSRARDLSDKLLPKGSHRRNFLKRLMPKGSFLWNFCKKIYRIFDKK